MIKLSIFLTRRPRMNHQEFISHWTREHARLLLTSRVVSDEERFLDREKTVMLITEEKPIIKMVDPIPERNAAS